MKSGKYLSEDKQLSDSTQEGDCRILKAGKTKSIADYTLPVNETARVCSGKKMIFAVIYAIYDTCCKIGTLCALEHLHST
jgi:hypothetical protein